MLPPLALLTDPLLFYEGRWNVSAHSAVADWPCSTLWFAARAGDGGATLLVEWSGVRLRINASAFPAAPAAAPATHSAIWDGFELEPPFGATHRHELPLPAGDSVVALRKLSSATPYSTGIATHFFRASRLELRALRPARGTLELTPWRGRPSRSVQLIGASDAAGWCVDGTPATPALSYGAFGWKHSDCDGAAGAELARRLGAAVSVQALAGAGLTQNANARERWQMGEVTMAGMYTRTLQSDAASFWDMTSHAPPQLVLISLGGNDYNHQEGHVPSDEVFQAAYVKLLGEIFRTYRGAAANATSQAERRSDGKREGSARAGGAEFAVVSICGQGSPEARLDPDNNRCRPCPHVEQSVQAFRKANPGLHAEYIFVPCDGSVVTGEGDIGCNGHKNRRGQNEVADFLEPRLRKLMGWD
ncbi:hypothetical protein AB1Y20_002911 [Prymnesium parvum]|uniref:SGNH hydrolase-type esterase domain-containing protein n=1 Tax=Prymnesium parvum TaxID=97485 RepID=A0AB34JC36_PRYPA